MAVFPGGDGGPRRTAVSWLEKRDGRRSSRPVSRVSSLDAATVLHYQLLSDWWCLASTACATCGSVMSQPLANPVNPHDQGCLARWFNRVRNSQLAHLGAGGPGLSNAAFAHGVQLLCTTMEDNHTTTLEFERNHSTKSFTEHHGEELGLPTHAMTVQRHPRRRPASHPCFVGQGQKRTILWHARGGLPKLSHHLPTSSHFD
jgi:hypothetical protein